MEDEVPQLVTGDRAEFTPFGVTYFRARCGPPSTSTEMCIYVHEGVDEHPKVSRIVHFAAFRDPGGSTGRAEALNRNTSRDSGAAGGPALLLGSATQRSQDVYRELWRLLAP